MQWLRGLIVLGIAVTSALAGACALSGPHTVNAALRRFEAVNQPAVFAATATALVDLGYVLERQDEGAGILTTRPILDSPEDHRERRPGRLSSVGATRRIAEVRLAQTAETISIYCRVIVQEQTTQAHRFLAGDYQGLDTPTTTAIERDAATTRQQNTVWRTIRRDKAAERRILSAVDERLNPTPRSGTGSDIP